ncbi:MAG: ATP-binding SpoIIE family protein phosphatase [Thermodesulfobacteriota bacterium]
MTDMKRFPVRSREEALAVRRAARDEAIRLDFTAAEVAEVETAAAELAGNLVKHAAGGGEVVLQPLINNQTQGLEIRVKDAGPGIADIERALAGGYSTAGTLGIGLSGVKRLMDEFAIQSAPNARTEITVRKWKHRPTKAILNFAVLAAPYPGEVVSGDGYFIRRFPDYEVFGVIDALGHGREAHAVAQRCLALLDAHAHEDLGVIVETCHRGLSKSRGAAMALARIKRGGRCFEHISIGNVETRCYNTPLPVRPYCYNGTIGMSVESGARVCEYRLARGAVIVMCSDGITGRFDVPPHLQNETAQRIAESIFSSHRRGTDDATVLVGKVI